MNKRTKQIIAGVSANVLFLLPVYFAFLNKETKTNWIIISISFLPLLIVLGGLRLIWGPDTFRKSAWREEGFSSFSEWFRKSQTLHGKFFRINIKFIMPVLFAATILAVIVIKILN
jgi:hypothetical protein